MTVDEQVQVFQVEDIKALEQDLRALSISIDEIEAAYGRDNDKEARNA